MIEYRVIPSLLLSGNGFVKTIGFKNPKYIGDPINCIKLFNDKLVDELVIYDINANKTNDGPNYAMLAKIANQSFIPLTYGGGITSVTQMEKLYKLGYEKLSLNSSILSDSSLLTDAVRIFGKQSVVVTIDITKDLFGNYKIYNHKLKKSIKTKLDSYIDEMLKIGFGELILNFVYNDGKQKGYDIELIKYISSKVDVPVIPLGGARNFLDFKEVLENTNASGVAAASKFIYKGKFNAVLINYLSEAELKELNKIYRKKYDIKL
jgi:cyclase